MIKRIIPLFLTSCLLLPGCSIGSRPAANGPAASNTNVSQDEAKPIAPPAEVEPYKKFTGNTTYADVVKEMGPPDAVKSYTREEVVLPTRLAFYASRNLSVVITNLTPQAGGDDALYKYVGTIRIHPAEVVHVAENKEGDSRPLLEFFRKQIQGQWEETEKRLRNTTPAR